mgnify:CR=1 FL=1
MEENKDIRIVEIDGQKFKVTSIYDDNAENDIINLIYDKFKVRERTGKLGFIENPFLKEDEK